MNVNWGKVIQFPFVSLCGEHTLGVSVEYRKLTERLPLHFRTPDGARARVTAAVDETPPSAVL